MPPTPNPTTTTTPTRLNQKTTTGGPLLSTSELIEEHASGNGTETDVNSLATAKKLLLTHELNMLAAGNMLQAISVAMFEFSHGITANLGATHTDIL